MLYLVAEAESVDRSSPVPQRRVGVEFGSEERHMVTTDPYEDGAQETRQDFTANDFRITRALDSLLNSAKSIKGDAVSAEDIAARVHTLRHLLKQVGHAV